MRVGGTWRVETRSPEGEVHNAGGVYREVAAPERLVFTMAWDGIEDGEPGRETVVTVGLAEEGHRTRMTFRQAVFSSMAARDGHDQGWSSAFELLAELSVREGKPHMTDDMADIRRILDQRTQALRAKDAAGLVAHYGEDLLTYDLAPPLATRGVDRPALEKWLAGWDGPSRPRPGT